MKIRLSPDITLPIDCITRTFAVLGMRGSGKTVTASVLTEQMIGAHLPVVAVDPVGVWWGLRHSRDGKSPGLPVIILGGEHADVPLEETGGAVIADFVIEHRRPSVLDLGLFSKGAQRRFMVDFAERLYLKNREALHVVIDECDTFIPQRIDHGAERLVGAINDLVRKGRARGLGVTLISQRPALVNKDVLTQVETLVAHRMTGPQDRDAIERWVEHNADQDGTNVLASLQALGEGDAWVWSPSWLKKLVRTHMNMRETFDSSATPKVGARAATPKHAAEVDLGELRVKLAATIEKAKADDPRELRRRIAELEKQIKVGRPAETKVVEKPVLTDEQVEELSTVTSKLDLAAARIANMATDVRRGLRAFADSQHAPSRPPATKPAAATNGSSQRAQLALGVGVELQTAPSSSTLGGGDAGDLTKGQLAVLQRVVHHGEITKSALITLTGYKRSTRDRLLQELRALGCVQDNGSVVSATDEGRRRCPMGELPTGDALMRWWLERLSEGQAAMLRAVAAAYPDAVAREEAGGTTDYARSTRDRLLQELQAAQLVTSPRRGFVVASEKLFD